jgi:hypothetical protein
MININFVFFLLLFFLVYEWMLWCFCSTEATFRWVRFSISKSNLFSFFYLQHLLHFLFYFSLQNWLVFADFFGLDLKQSINLLLFLCNDYCYTLIATYTSFQKNTIVAAFNQPKGSYIIWKVHIKHLSSFNKPFVIGVSSRSVHSFFFNSQSSSFMGIEEGLKAI